MRAEFIDMDALKQIMAAQAPQPSAPKDKPIQARVLLDMLPLIHRINPFEPGNLVEQVKSRAAYNYPDDTVFLVTHVFQPEVSVQARAHNNTPREDMLVAVISPCGSSGHWHEWAVESWRFERYAGPIE